MTTAKGKAPRPVKGGRTAAARKVDLGKQVLEIVIKGESFGRLRYPAVPMNEIMAVRQQVGVPWTDITGEAGVAPDVSTYAVLAWLAKRANGLPGLSWEVFNRGHWPDDFVSLGDCSAPVVDLDAAEDSDPES